MDQRTDDLEQSIVETRQDIEETRAAMTEKLELLEERVRDTLEETKAAVGDIVDTVKDTVGETVDTVKDTVDGAKATVENIVENVKETMDDTVTKVKQSFDLRYQVEQHPWMMLGGSVMAGSVLASFMDRKSHRRSESQYVDTFQNGSPVSGKNIGSAIYTVGGNGGHTPSQESPQYNSTTKSNSWTNTLGQFQEEIDLVKGVVTSAILSTVVGTLQAMIRQNMPSMAVNFDKAIKRASKKWDFDFDGSLESNDRTYRSDQGRSDVADSSSYGLPESHKP